RRGARRRAGDDQRHDHAGAGRGRNRQGRRFADSYVGRAGDDPYPASATRPAHAGSPGGSCTGARDRGRVMPILFDVKDHVARVNGHAVGGGFEMVLGCDIIIAAQEATFGLPEARVGRMPLDGGMTLLQRQVPFHLAMGVLLTGKRISATEAYRIGLVNEVVPRAELDAAVARWVDDVLACAPLS